MEKVITFLFNLIISISLGLIVLLFLPFYLLFKSIMFVIMEFRFFGGALIEAIRASITKTKYPRTFEFAARLYLSEMFKSLFEILRIPFVVWRENDDTQGKSLKELLKDELEIYSYNWGITLFILISLCLSFAITATYFSKGLFIFKPSIVKTSYSISQPISSEYQIKNKEQDAIPTPPKNLNNYNNELDALIKLDSEIQNNSLTNAEMQKKLTELGEKFTVLLNTVDDCNIAKRIYSFAKEKLEPHYGTNNTVQQGLIQIKNKCLN